MSVVTRTAKDGTPTYFAVFRDRTGTQHWEGFARKADAQDRERDVRTQVREGTYRKITAITMLDVCAKWRDKLDADVLLGTIKPSTAHSYRGTLRNHIEPAFGACMSDELTDESFTKWRTSQAKRVGKGELSPATYNHVVALLRLLLDWAVTQKYLPTNPMPRKMRARGERFERTIVEGDDITRLWDTVTGVDRVIVALALFCGLRRGEIFALRWLDIGWPKGKQRATLHITQNVVRGHLGTPKSAAGRRIVFVPARVVELLREHERTCPPLAPPSGRGAFVLRRDDWRPLDGDAWASRYWPTLRTAAGLADGVTLHSFRHTYGSLLLADGAPNKHVSTQMGHASTKVTEDVYQHVLRASIETATDLLDKHVPTTSTPTTPAPRKRATLRLAHSA